SGVNTYTGNTAINGGVLSVASSANLGDGSTTNNLSLAGGTLLATGAISSAGRNVTVNGAGGTVDSGANSVTFGNVDGTAGLTKQGSGNLTVNYARIAGLNVTGGQLIIVPNGQAAGVSAVNSTTIASARLDIGDNHLIDHATGVGSVTAGIYNGITGYIQAGRGTGSWNGTTGIITSQTVATSSNFNSIGVATGQEVKGLATATDTAVWAGQTVTGSDTLVMYTYGGDANLDGKINVDDYG